MSLHRHGNDIAHYRRQAYGARTSIALSCIKLVTLGLGYVPFARAIPFDVLSYQTALKDDGAPPLSGDDPSLWIYLGTAMVLVLLGGALAGLTIALMGQDEIYLQVIATSGEGSERKNASRVLWLLRKGKHWVLVTLLLGNVITNETLPIMLDRSIGGGWPAVAASTALVVIFGEIVPQSICVRYGLPIGAMTAPFTLLMMWLLFPVSWPIAKLLDYLLGEDHGTTYKKAGLKQLVSLHKTLGTTPGERLNQDEVTIISAVLDLKDKSVGSIMTPMDDVFTLSADAVLDDELMQTIMREGYSRIPIYEPKNRGDFVGMLLVKMLITYDPEDCKRVSEFSLATLPETRPETSCLDIINFFQDGKSHMVLVSDFPGLTYGALGVVTLEDVIEELIGEEIIDESDVFVNIHKAIRRMAPAPTHYARIPKGEIVVEPENNQAEADEDLLPMDDEARMNRSNSVTDSPRGSYESGRRVRTSLSGPGRSATPTPATTYYVRRKSSLGGSVDGKPIQMRGYASDIKQQLQNLGPSNAANRPKQTRVNTVKIKPAVGTIPERTTVAPDTALSSSLQRGTVTTPYPTAAQEGTGRDLISPGHSAKDGVQALAAGYGFPNTSSSVGRSPNEETRSREATRTSPHDSRRSGHHPSKKRTNSHSTLGSIRSHEEDFHRHGNHRHGTVRSGSITEQLVDVGGVKKLVLEMTSSSEEADHDLKGSQKPSRQASRATSQHSYRKELPKEEHAEEASATGKKKRRKRPHKKKDGSGAGGSAGDENKPLLSPYN